MLDDDAGGIVEAAHTLERSVGVGDVVVTELFALHKARVGDAAAGAARLQK